MSGKSVFQTFFYKRRPAPRAGLPSPRKRFGARSLPSSIPPLKVQYALQVAARFAYRRRLPGEFRPDGDQAVPCGRLRRILPLVGRDIVETIGQILGRIGISRADYFQKHGGSALAIML